MWAVCTRFQADTDMDVIRNGMGAILDPSNRNGATAKLMIDATRKKQTYAKRHSLPEDVQAMARKIVESHSPRR